MRNPADFLTPLGISLLASAFWPLFQSWKRSAGLPLQAAIAWASVSLVLSILGMYLGRDEASGTGRPIAGQWTYLATLTTLAAATSVLNARSPGGTAWAILMGLLVLVFLVPWLEGAGLARGRGAIDRLRLDPPWNLFYGLVMVAGITNYLPTCYGAAAGLVGLALALEWAGLAFPAMRSDLRALIWSAVPGLFALSAWLAWFRSARRTASDDGLTRLWFWFRDHWGVVWALRVLERFNRAAEAADWPIRMTWHGPTPIEGRSRDPVPPEAGKTLITILRRFAPIERLRAIAEG